MTTIDLSQRNSRQKDLVPEEQLRKTEATIVGVGAIGRQVAIQLSAMGVGNLQLVDHDTVEVANLAPQGFSENDLGIPKVNAVANICRDMNSDIEIETLQRKFRNTDFFGDVLFCCVDSIETRKMIFNGIKNNCKLFIDGRMSAEFLRVLCVSDEKSSEYYQTQIFPANEAYQGSCTAKSTIYCANIAAGIMVAQFVKWLRKIPLDCNIDWNILTNEILVKE